MILFKAALSGLCLGLACSSYALYLTRSKKKIYFTSLIIFKAAGLGGLAHLLIADQSHGLQSSVFFFTAVVLGFGAGLGLGILVSRWRMR